MKGRGHGGTRWVQRGMTLLLVVCCVQVLWWIWDEARYVTRMRDELLELRESHARAAAMLSAMGMSEDRITSLFHDVTQAESGGYMVIPQVKVAIEEMRYRRINRYGWEGSFFLLVLVVGMGVIGAAVRQEARARRQEQEFLAAVSHELKTPLAGMRLSAETLALRDPPTERRRELVGRILGDIDRLEGMVLNVLDVARLEHQGFQLRREPLRLRGVVAAALSKVESTAAACGATLVADVPEGLSILGDPDASRTVVENLLSNAVKAVSATEGGGRVEATARETPRGVELVIRDDGIGFDPREADRIFRKFHRAHSGTGEPVRGSGLGLYLVAHLVRQGGGAVHAESEGRGKGARFTVLWPSSGEET